jgi:putative transposase
MARKPRLCLVGMPHHIVQRGNNKDPIFFSDGDYLLFLDILREAKRKHPCLIYGYCLMPNHFHFLVAPLADENLSLFMKLLGGKYVRNINKAYGRTGSLWESRFKCALVDNDAYFLTCLRYIEMNPVRAGIVSTPDEYRWSSFRFRGHGEDYNILDSDLRYEGLGTCPRDRQEEYRRFFQDPNEDAVCTWMRETTHKGGIIGSNEFINKIQQVIGKDVITRPQGRPSLGEK